VTDTHFPPLAHGVGRVYELPIPLGLYLAAAATTVLVSFFVRAFVTTAPKARPRKQIVGSGAARMVAGILRVLGVAGLLLALGAGIVARSEGFTLTTLLFWVGLIVGMLVVSAVLAGAWEAADPWATLERVYRIEIEDEDGNGSVAPWWLAPAGLYVLFWFELVSHLGFVDFWIVMALLLYSLFSFSARARFADNWAESDPLSVLFGWAGRIAPFRLQPEGIYRKGLVDELDEPRTMPLGLFAALFVLLAATTFDNVSETVGWSSFLASTKLDALPVTVANSAFLLAFSLLFFVPFLLSVGIARFWIGSNLPLLEIARRFAWSLIPIAIAYVLAHNAPLLISGVPLLLRQLSDPIGRGWNLFGTAHVFEGFIISPELVWFVEIALIVGGHILAVLAAHRTAWSIGRSRVVVLRSQYALMALMSLYTVATLWLLAQPLVV
jgi:hypothetical protein